MEKRFNIVFMLVLTVILDLFLGGFLVDNLIKDCVYSSGLMFIVFDCSAILVYLIANLIVFNTIYD